MPDCEVINDHSVQGQGHTEKYTLSTLIFWQRLFSVQILRSSALTSLNVLVNVTSPLSDRSTRLKSVTVHLMYILCRFVAQTFCRRIDARGERDRMPFLFIVLSNLSKVNRDLV